MTYNEKTKQSDYKWRQNNLEAYRAVVLKSSKTYYNNNKQEIAIRRSIAYWYKQQVVL